MLVKSALWTGMLAVAVVSMGSTAKADHFTHQGRLVRDIEILHHAVEDFYDEVHFHNRFSSLAGEARALLRDVDHFCETAQRYGSLSHLRRDFRDVSREMQHVQRDLNRSWRYHSHFHNHDRHILAAWANVERAFDRVYFDLYENHCGFIQYQCSIGGGHGHGHGHGHGGFNPGHGGGPFIPNNSPFYGNKGISFGVSNGKFQFHIGGRTFK